MSHFEMLKQPLRKHMTPSTTLAHSNPLAVSVSNGPKTGWLYDTPNYQWKVYQYLLICLAIYLPTYPPACHLLWLSTFHHSWDMLCDTFVRGTWEPFIGWLITSPALFWHMWFPSNLTLRIFVHCKQQKLATANLCGKEFIWQTWGSS